jgi:hypothetical protein
MALVGLQQKIDAPVHELAGGEEFRDGNLHHDLCPGPSGVRPLAHCGELTEQGGG